MKEKKLFKIAYIFDTETTNIKCEDEWRAFPILYIFNDVRGCNLSNYKLGDGNIEFFRYDYQAIKLIQECVAWGRSEGVTPIIAAYNLIFDLRPLLYLLRGEYDMKVVARSGTQVYVLDILDERGNAILRFWDTFYLEMGGLASMGRICGIPKAEGSWDYERIRTPETPLTDEELFYAGRDTEVIPCFLSYLVKANSWLKPHMFGCEVMTKTSLVRQMAKKELFNKKINTKNTIGKYFMMHCNNEKPRTYEDFARRKACFRGGFTFTAANYANTVLKNVSKLDTVSMHHTFINGMFIPRRWHYTSNTILRKMLLSVERTTMKQVLNDYAKPFRCAFHAHIALTNLRLKKGSAFEKLGIAILSEAKFSNNGNSAYEDARNYETDRDIKISGYKDKAYGAVFAFGKLMSAKRCELYVSECEYWLMSQVYDWDEVLVLDGECSTSFMRAPDYVVLQSHILYERKNIMKYICNNYKEGEPLDIETSHVPGAILDAVNNGSAELSFLDNYYRSTVKGQFNGIYGVMAQVEYRPDFMIDEVGNILIDETTRINDTTFVDASNKRSKVLYTYGMRIVGRSRMHLAIAIMLLYEKYKDNCIVSGGDTDSLLIKKPAGVSAQDLQNALMPLAIASKKAIDIASARVRELYPDYASELNGVGSFDIEEENYLEHMEAWNKARISLDEKSKVHITLAGISRPPKLYNIETLAMEYIDKGYTFEQIAKDILGYNTIVSRELSYYLAHHIPSIESRFRGYVTDYMGNKAYVDAPEAIALYETGKMIGDSANLVNAQNVQYLNSIGHDPDTTLTILSPHTIKRKEVV